MEALTEETAFVGGNVRLFATDEPHVAWVPMSSVGEDLSRVGSHLDVKMRTTVRVSVGLKFESVARNHRVRSEHLFRTTVYNLEVEDFHTYYVGDIGVWAHNKNLSLKAGVGGMAPTDALAARPFYSKGEMYAYLKKHQLTNETS